MRRPSKIRWTTTFLLSAVLGGILWRGHRPTTGHPPQPTAAPRAAPALRNEPHVMLWAWEVPEDLTTLDPHTAGIAFLSRELLVTDRVQVRPRRQPLRVAPNAWLIAVVRIETAPHFLPPLTLEHQAAAEILAALEAPNVRSLQIDFDATASQRAFYTAVLREVRQHLPPGIPLSITALTSWCGADSWLHALPVDEAVPMFFRMGGPAATRATSPRSNSLLEPLCTGSVGVSTDEAWPAIAPSQRVYIFNPHPWTNADLARLTTIGYTSLHGARS